MSIKVNKSKLKKSLSTHRGPRGDEGEGYDNIHHPTDEDAPMLLKDSEEEVFRVVKQVFFGTRL